MLRYVFTGIFLFFTAAAAVFLRRSFILRKHRKSLEAGDINTSALAAYGFVSGIVRFLGVRHSDFISELEFSQAAERLGIACKGGFTAAAQTALKAAFGGQSITEEEHGMLIRLAHEAAERIYTGSSLWHRFKFRYIFVYDF